MYRKAPLPFTGQKRNFLKLFKQVLNDHIPGDGEDWTILDAFGGSGRLSRTAQQCKPAARVIYNDYDGYSARLQHIPDINRLRRLLAGILEPVPRSKPVPPAIKAAIRSFGGYIDLDCLVSWLLFSGNTAADLDELCRKTMYNCISLSDYPEAQDYLQGVEIVGQSYRELLPQPAHVIGTRPALRLHPAGQLPQGSLLRHGRVPATNGNGAAAICLLLQHPQRTARLSRPRGRTAPARMGAFCRQPNLDCEQHHQPQF